jgi:CheY-like chemotaxis protein
VSLSILVVDDEPDVEALFRQQFRRELRAGRFAMEFAPSAAAALTMIGGTMTATLILILSDINMPGMNGLELLKAIKTRYPHLKVIMVTAYGDENTHKRAVESGCDDYLTKPIDFGTLKEHLGLGR